MYEIIFILSLIVTASLSYDSEFNHGLSSEMQSADRYLESSSDNLDVEYSRKYPRQEHTKSVLPIQPSFKGVIRPRTDNYEHRLRTNAPPLARVPIHRQQEAYIQRDTYRPKVKEDMTRNVEEENFEQQERRPQNQERKYDPYQNERSRQPNDNKNTFSRPYTNSMEITTPVSKDTYEEIQYHSTSNDDTLPNNAEFDQSHTRVEQNNGRYPKIPRRNFTLNVVSKNTPLQTPQPDRAGGINSNNRVKTIQNNPLNRSNEPNRSQGQINRNDQFNGDSSNDAQENLSKTSEENHNSSSREKTGENEQWIMEGEGTGNKKKTTAVAYAVAVDDRSNFDGDKCPGGMVRVCGQCVNPD